MILNNNMRIQIPRRLFYMVAVLSLIVVLCIFHGTHVYETVDIPNKRWLLEMRAKTSWLNNHPQPLKALTYIRAKNSTSEEKPSNDYESSDEELWDNMLNLNYWTSSYADESSSIESWQDIINETSHLTQLNKTEEEFSSIPECHERRPVVITDDGQRQIPPELYNMAPTIFESVPTKFMERIRNPCWREENDILCLPAFFLAGFPKAGTTDLWAKISAHPHVVRSVKEPHYWTRRRIDSANYYTLRRYSDNYSGISELIKINDTEKQNLIVGDGSASTMWDNHRWRNYFDFDACKDHGPPYVIADIIHTILPNSKILVILRNPTDRLYSDYIYFGSKLRTAETFHNDVIETIDWFNACLQIASHRTCAYSHIDEINEKLPLVRLNIGLYSVYVRDWLKVFPRDQLMFLRLEDWHDMCPEILPKVYTFLELASLPSSWTTKICSLKQQNPTKRVAGPMFEKTRAILDQFYLSTNQELAAILQDVKFLWK
ncbi:carbohydrate sulfotransferase 15-like [Amphiura filiformis]|uniref:carbohydrate sulfotransferase 15-like n=1 Tax=Amphiura filiformis TaxID=82378 RepID=UPI003B2129E5